jgi:hypothetical protein
MKNSTRPICSAARVLLSTSLFFPALSQAVPNFVANLRLSFDPSQSVLVDQVTGNGYSVRNATGAANIQVLNGTMTVINMTVNFEAAICVPLTATCTSTKWHHFAAKYNTFSGAAATGATLGVYALGLCATGTIQMDQGANYPFDIPCGGQFDYVGPPPLNIFSGNVPINYDTTINAFIPALGPDHISASLISNNFLQSSIPQKFGPATPANSSLWFNSNGKITNIKAGTVISFRYGVIYINGVPNTVPDADVVFSSTATCSITSYDSFLNKWTTIMPLQGDDEVFLTGLILPLSSAVPKHANVVWSQTVFYNQPVDFCWKWGAAAYSSFTTDYNQLQVKPGLQTSCNYNNADHAGTPEAFPTAIAGGTGEGGSNRTGSWSSAVNAKTMLFVVSQ